MAPCRCRATSTSLPTISTSASARVAASLARDEPENGLRPSVSWLFRSMAENLGGSAVGVLLTGMGKDGAAELKLMRDRGSMTIAQDRESSIVHGMPGEAIALGAAVQILPADRIAAALLAEITRRVQHAGGLEA